MTTRFTAWVLLSLLLLCAVPMSDPSDTFGEPSEVMTAEGRQLDDVNCSGMTFSTQSPSSGVPFQ